MRNKFLSFVAWLMLLCLLVNAVPSNVDASGGTVTYDFNSVDFNIAYQSGANIGSDAAATL